jgi:cytochrome P450
MIALHAQYGEVVRASPEELSFIHPDAWRDIYGHGSGQGKGTLGSVPPKNWKWYGKASNGVASLITEQSAPDHARVRRIFKPAFSDRALKEQEPLFMKYVEQLVGNLRKTVSDEPEHQFDMVKNYNCKSAIPSLRLSIVIDIDPYHSHDLRRHGRSHFR